MSVISNTQTDILELLARFKFLVISQMTPLLAKSTGYVRIQLAKLIHLGYIKSYQLDKPMKAENMYYLTEAGKEIVASNPKVFAQDIKLPIGVPLIVRDYAHRKHMIDVQISLYYHLTTAGFTIKEFICYYDKVGANRKAGTLEAKTKIPLDEDGRFFIPDGIMITEHNSRTCISLVEMYCDLSPLRVLDQLQKHVLAIAHGTPAKKFGLTVNPTVLSAFEYDRVKNKVIDKLLRNDEFEPFRGLFFFATLDDIKKDGFTAWKSVNNEPLSFVD